MTDGVAVAKKDTVDAVTERIKHFQDNGQLHFPANYSPENALKSAWLKLQATTDKNGKPALEVCTKDSVANALLDMAIQGLNPSKNQCYLLVYGNKLVCQRSYFGTMAVTKNLTGAKEIYAEVVYKGDDFAFEIVRGRKRVIKHVQKLESIEAAEIQGAYCTIILSDDSEHTDFMSMAEIKKAWSMSRTNSTAENSTHNKFPQEMCKKTVINRACKTHLNSSDDSSLMMQVVQRSSDSALDAEVEEEIAQNANQEIIDIEPMPEQKKQPEPAQRKQDPPVQVKRDVDDTDQLLMDFERDAVGAGPGF